MKALQNGALAKRHVHSNAPPACWGAPNNRVHLQESLHNITYRNEQLSNIKAFSRLFHDGFNM